MTLRNIIIIATLLVTHAAANGQDDFSTAVDRIAANNIGMRAFEQKLNGERATLATSNNLQNPELEFEHQWGQQHVGNKWSVGVCQSFDWPGVYTARRRAITASSAVIDRMAAARRNEVRRQIAASLVNLVYARKQIALFSQMKSNVDSLLSATNREMERGEVSRLDVNKLKIEQMLTGRRLNQASLDYRESLAELCRLNGGEPVEQIVENINEYPDHALLPLNEYLRLAETANPEVKLNKAENDAARMNLDAVTQSNLPGFSLGYSHIYELGDHFNGIKVGISLPFFSNKGKKAEAQSRILSLDTQLADIIKTATKSTEEKYRQILDLDKEIQQISTVINDPEQMRLLNIAYAARHITLSEYISQVNYLLEAESQLLDLCHQRALLAADLNQWLTRQDS